LTDFDEIRILELPSEDHPPRKISFRSVDVGGLGEYPVCHCWVSVFVMVALCNRADHNIFMLWFVLLLSSFFSSPKLTRRRLDVCRMADIQSAAAGVALVRI